MAITYLILVTGVCCSAISFVFIRESTEPPVMLAAYRVLLAGLLLLPVYFRDSKRYGAQPFAVIWKRSWLPGLVLGVHFIAWVVGARMTTGANATLIVSMMPIIMPILMFTMFQERIRPREIIATIIAITGVLLLGFNDFTIDRRHFNGDLICLVSMILFALYLSLARSNRAIPSVWLYIVPVYLIAGISTLLVALFFSSPIHAYTPYNALNIIAVALVSTVIGHSALNYGMQRLRGQTVTVINMGGFIVAGIVGYFFYQEVPAPTFYMSSALLLLAMGLIVTQADA